MGWGPTGCGQLEMTAVVLGLDAGFFTAVTAVLSNPREKLVAVERSAVINCIASVEGWDRCRGICTSTTGFPQWVRSPPPNALGF